MDRKKVFRQNNNKKLCEYLSKRKCVDCGEKNIVVLEFDHIENKVKEISRLIRNNAWGIVLKEIEKCEVVCSNCHKIRTAIEQNWYKLRYKKEKEVEL